MQARPEDLLNLPELEPPPEARERVLAAMRAAARGRGTGRRRPAVAAAAALAVAAAGLALVGVWHGGRSDSSTTVGAPPSGEDYGLLVAESEQLERALEALPAQRRVMRADTAGTIAGLEGRIAAIDAQLLVAAATGLRPEQRAPLWRERVEIMNALVQVRYVQSSAFVF